MKFERCLPQRTTVNTTSADCFVGGIVTREERGAAGSGSFPEVFSRINSFSGKQDTLFHFLRHTFPEKSSTHIFRISDGLLNLQIFLLRLAWI